MQGLCLRFTHLTELCVISISIFLLAPLHLARNPVVVPVHFRARAALQKERGFCARGHLRTVRSTITFERGNTRILRPWEACCWRLLSLDLVSNKSLRLEAVLILGIAVPTKRGNDEQDDKAVHVSVDSRLEY